MDTMTKEPATPPDGGAQRKSEAREVVPPMPEGFGPRMKWLASAAWLLIRETAAGWSEAKAPRLGAALAFYTMFSLAPLLVIAVGVAAVLFGRDAAEGQLATQLHAMLGETAAKAIQAMLAGAYKPGSGVIASIIGIVTLLIGSTGLFVELQDALNTIWGIKERRGNSVVLLLRKRLLSFAFVLGMGLLLLTTLILSAVVSAVQVYVELLPFSALLLQVGNQVLSLGITTALLAMMYKLMPDARIAWRDVWVGALGSALLFTLGKYLIGLYLGRSGFTSAFGAAGSLVVLLSWVYYSAQILLFGAEFTQHFAERFGSHVRSIDDDGTPDGETDEAADGERDGRAGPAERPARLGQAT